MKRTSHEKSLNCRPSLLAHCCQRKGSACEHNQKATDALLVVDRVVVPEELPREWRGQRVLHSLERPSTHCQRIVKVASRCLVTTEEELGDARLEVCDGKVRIESDGAVEGGDGLVVLPHGSVDEGDVEKDLGSVGNVLRGKRATVEPGSEREIEVGERARPPHLEAGESGAVVLRVERLERVAPDLQLLLERHCEREEASERG